MSTLAVLLEHGSVLPPVELLADIFAERAGFPRPVALRLAGRARGIVWEGAPAQSAQAVCDGLVASGFAARTLPQAAVVRAVSPRRVHVLNLEGDALGIQWKYTGPPQWIPWSHVLVLSAGVIKTETRKVEVHETVVGKGLRITDERVQVDLTRTMLADIYVQLPEGELQSFRLNCHEINYAQTIGGSVHEGWREKFSLLLARLGLRATAALISPETEGLLAARLVADEAIPSPYFANEEEFELYNRWLATSKRLGATA